MNIEEIVTQVVMMAVGGVSTWSIWVTKRHLKMKCDINQAFIKIRALEKEINDGRDSCKAAGCDCREVDD